MLQIYVYGSKESGFLDLADTVLDMESTSDIFDEDLSTGEFSLPVDIPWTDNNRRLLGFAERLENFKTASSVRSWRVAVYDDGFPELPNATMAIVGKSGKFNYARGKFSVSISGSKGIFGAAIKSKTLQDLSYGGPITLPSSMEGRTFATNLMKGSYPQYHDMFCFVPVAIESFFDDQRPDYDDAHDFLEKDVVNWVEVAGGNWSFTNPAASDRDSFRSVPFFYLKYILRKVFEEHGFTLTGDFMTTPDFDNLVVFNNYALEKYGALVDYNTLIVPSNHVPKVPINEFLQGVFTFFNMYPVFMGASTVRLVYRTSSLRKDRKVMSLNDVVASEFESNYEKANNTQNGYKLSYGWDGADGYHGDRVKDGQFLNQKWNGTTGQWEGTWSNVPKDKTLVATVDKVAYLDNLNIGRQLTTDDIAFVTADNMYYMVADATTIPIKWDAFAENLGDYVVGNGDKSVDCKLSTLCSYVEDSIDDALFEKRNYVGTRQPGSYVNAKGVRVVNDFGLRIFYANMANVEGLIIPLSYNHNRDKNNTKLEKYSLAWDGPEGIATNFHSEWQNLTLDLESVKVQLYGTKRTLEDMAQANTFEIGGTLFLPYKMERTIPMNKGNFDLWLVPL